MNARKAKMIVIRKQPRVETPLVHTNVIARRDSQKFHPKPINAKTSMNANFNFTIVNPIPSCVTTPTVTSNVIVQMVIFGRRRLASPTVIVKKPSNVEPMPSVSCGLRVKIPPRRYPNVCAKMDIMAKIPKNSVIPFPIVRRIYNVPPMLDVLRLKSQIPRVEPRTFANVILVSFMTS